MKTMNAFHFRLKAFALIKLALPVAPNAPAQICATDY